MPQVGVKRTVVSMRDYARAVLKAWKADAGDFPAKKSVAVLYAQYMIETGGKACWNWNIGNVKHVPGDGYDYIELRGVWEGVHPFAASGLISRGEAVLDTNPEHIKAVGSKKTAVIFNPPHPATRFRAYPSLDMAMTRHLKLLKGRFGLCWPDVVDGDYKGFAHTLKAGPDGKEDTRDDYFTAEAEAYAKGMSGHFFAFANSDVFDSELAAIIGEMESPTLDKLPDPDETMPPDSDTQEVLVPEIRPDPLGHVAVVHPRVPLGGSTDYFVCTRCGAENPAAQEACPLGAEMPDGHNEPHNLA